VPDTRRARTAVCEGIDEVEPPQLKRRQQAADDTCGQRSHHREQQNPRIDRNVHDARKIRREQQRQRAMDDLEESRRLYRLAAVSIRG
jgi:hypothetical protein